MPIPFLNSITLNKNEIQEFKVYNLTPDPTLTSAGDYGYMWLNTSDSPKTLKWWDGTSIRSIVDSGNTSTLTVGTANDLSGGVAGSLPYQQGVGDTTFLGIGSSGYILTSTGSAPQWSASIPSSSVSGLAASATTDTTNASNISSGTLGLARLSLASGQFYVGDGSNNPAATAKSSIPLSGFGNAAADINIGGFKITNSGTIGSGDADSTVATKGYVDSVAQGLDVKASCLVATTADITLASPGAVTIDGIYSATDFTAGTTRILVKDQSAPAENGIYIWQGPSSAMTRSSDANTWDELVGAFTFIERGTANADSGWVCTVNAGGTLGSTAVTWVKFSQAGSYTAGNGIVQSGTSFNFAQSAAYTAGQIPFASSTTAMGFSSNLHWDNTKNSLGIGTATPSLSGHRAVTINAATGGVPILEFSVNGTLGAYLYGNGSITTLNSQSTAPLTIETNGAERLRIASDGVCTWSNVGGVAGTAMTLNATGLGVGVSPNYPLTVNGTIRLSGGNGTKVTWASDASSHFIQFSSTLNGLIVDGYDGVQLQTRSTPRVTVDSSGNVGVGTTSPGKRLTVADASPTIRLNDTNTSVAGGVFGTIDWLSQDSSMPGGLAAKIDVYDDLGGYGDRGAIRFFTNNGTSLGERMVLTSSGNLGLGVTPSAWGPSNFKSIDLNTRGAFGGTSGGAYVVYNAFYNASNQWIYKQSDTAAYYAAELGAHKWFTASSGTAGNQITWTQSMTLDASGNLGVGTASPSTYGKLAVLSGATATTAYFDTTAATAYSSTSFFAGPNITIRTAANATGNGSGIRFASSSNGSLEGFFGWVQNASGYGDFVFQGYNGAYTERLRIKSTGQLNFTGLSSDPAGAAGDVYYNSGSNVFKVYDTGWKTLPRKYVVQLSDGSVTVVGNAYTLTHNFASKDVTISIRRTTDDAVVLADVTMPTTNTATVTFASAITAANYYVTVIG